MTTPLFSAATQSGLFAAAILVIGAIGLHWLEPRGGALRGHTKKQWIAAAVLLVIVTPVALSGIWFSLDQWGISDWDYYFSLHHTYREIILKYHQFPFWNPVTCGGTAGLADPEFSVFTPTFLLELIFGVERGLRLAIFLATAVGGLGILTLNKKLKLPVLAGLVAATAYMFGSVNLLEIVEGHVNVFSAMWIPWVFYTWFRAYRREIRPLWCGLFLAITFYQAGIYLLMYTGLAFLLLPFLTSHWRQAWKINIQVGAWALGLAAMKLIPVFLWLRQFQDTAYASSTWTLPYLHKILLGRYLHGSEVLPNQGGGWHEYGAYIGPIVFTLALLGATQLRQRIVRGLLITTIAALLLSSAGPLLKPLFDMAPFLPRSNISRFVLFAILPLSLLAGFGVAYLQKIKRVGTPLAYLLVALVAIDLMTMANALSLQPFTVPPHTALAPANPPLEFTALTYDYETPNREKYTRSYAAVLAGYGALNYCSSIGPEPMVRTIHDEGNHGILQFNTTETNNVQLITWSPNKMHIQGTATQKTDITLNTNFAQGWKINKQAATSISGRPGISLPPGQFDLTFTYHAPGFILGLLVTLITTGLAFFYPKVRKLRA